jgi:hypothetical protein
MGRGINWSLVLQQFIVGIVWIGAVFGAWKTYKESRELDRREQEDDHRDGEQ